MFLALLIHILKFHHVISLFKGMSEYPNELSSNTTLIGTVYSDTLRTLGGTCHFVIGDYAMILQWVVKMTFFSLAYVYHLLFKRLLISCVLDSHFSYSNYRFDVICPFFTTLTILKCKKVDVTTWNFILLIATVRAELSFLTFTTFSSTNCKIRISQISFRILERYSC